MHGKKFLLLGAALALAYASVAGVSAPAGAAEPIKIGYVGGISGPCGGLTHSAVKAMKIALAEINAAGGAAGRKIEVIWRDSKTKPDEGAKQTRDLILTEKVDRAKTKPDEGAKQTRDLILTEKVDLLGSARVRSSWRSTRSRSNTACP